MEQRLAEYRANRSHNKAGTPTPHMTVTNDRDPDKYNVQNDEESLLPEKEDESGHQPKNTLKLPNFIANSRIGRCLAGNNRLPSITLILKLLLWLMLWGFFIEIEFGSVFFVLSLFYGIYLTLRTRPKMPDEPSAYSVFNPNCERIDGTFTAEQLERELMGGAIAGMMH